MKTAVYRFNSDRIGEAFFKELLDIGYERIFALSEDFRDDWDVNCIVNTKISGIHTSWFYGWKNRANKVFQLESQYQQALDYAKKRIEEENKPTLEEGKWYAMDNCEGGETFLGRYEGRSTDDGLILETHACSSEQWDVKDEVHNLRPATPEEIEAALIKEAKRRGFKNGVTFNSLQNDGLKCMGNDRFHYLHGFNKLQFGEPSNSIGYHGDMYHGVIYAEGKWAEVIEEPLTIDGYDAKVKNTEVSVGCQSYHIGDIKSFLEIFDAFIENDVLMSNENIDVLRKVVE